MAQKTGYPLLQEKVPAFKDQSKAAGIMALCVLIFSGIMIFFWWFDGLWWYGSILSQLAMVLLCSPFMCWFFKKPQAFRTKYGERAYSPFFFRIVIPMFITANAGIFHVLLVGGPALMPLWVMIPGGSFLLVLRFLMEDHIRRSGFDEVGHGFGIFSVFPEEGRRINAEIYAYIRHPMYAGDFCMALGLSLFMNNWLAILVGCLSFAPYFLAAMLEDRELGQRFGAPHQQYIKETHAFFPRAQDLGRFLKLLFSRGTKGK